jgi:hypothetical protein
MQLRLHRSQRAQTILEYLLMLILFAFPMGLLMKSFLEDSEKDARDNVLQEVSSSAYGKKNNFGIIGRPYP